MKILWLHLVISRKLSILAYFVSSSKISYHLYTISIRSRHVTGRTTLRLVGGRIQHLDRHACYKLVICILMFVLSYMMWCLLYVFYIKLELYLSGGFKSITVGKASSIFYNKLALTDSLRLFNQSKGWHNWNLRWINNKYLKFKFIIPGLRISARQEGII